MLENERLFKSFVNANANDAVLILTGSGTAGMDASILNCIHDSDRILIIHGGVFGERFVEICTTYGLDFSVLTVPFGEDLTPEMLLPYENKGYSAVMVNMSETSTGVLFDIDLLGSFCRRNGCFFIVDAISSFLADPIDVQASNCDIVIVGSQKGLALPPGVVLVLLSETAQQRSQSNPRPRYYLDFNRALNRAVEGQTPFTPAVGVIYQLNDRLRDIQVKGLEATLEITRFNAEYFRNMVSKLPLKILNSHISNALTLVELPRSVSARKLVAYFAQEYEIIITVSGADSKDRWIRVGHLGAIEPHDYDYLIEKLAHYLQSTTVID